MRFTKLISGIIAASMLSGMLVVTVHADGAAVDISGGKETGKPIELSYSGGTPTAVVWETGSSADGDDFAEITLNDKVDTRISIG